MSLPNFTPEERQAILVKAREAKLLKSQLKEATKHLLKREYLDRSYWSCLASESNIRMPSNDEAVDVPTIRKYLKRAKVDVDTWNEHYTSMSYFVKNNPKYTKYAAVGLILELKNELEKGLRNEH